MLHVRPLGQWPGISPEVASEQAAQEQSRQQAQADLQKIRQQAISSTGGFTWGDYAKIGLVLGGVVLLGSWAVGRIRTDVVPLVRDWRKDRSLIKLDRY